MALLTVCVLFSCLSGLSEANLTSYSQSPRMTFTDKDIAMKRIPYAGHHAPVRILMGGESETVMAAGQKRLTSFSFQNPQKAPVERTPLWEGCPSGGGGGGGGGGGPQGKCSYELTVVLERNGSDLVFVCGTNSWETVCCDMDLSERSPTCRHSGATRAIREGIKGFIVKEGEPSALVESAGSADLYVTHSGSGQYVGVHKFGRNRVGQANRNKEQHYVGVVVSRRTDEPLQDTVYAFYNERNRDADLYGVTWLPFVTRVCMADVGGPKNTLQFAWTSQMSARLYCGDPESRRHFSELVDVATVHADRWQDTRVYALFRNEWSMSAVCVFTIRDIDHIFATSPFKGTDRDRPRACVSDSKRIPLNTLTMIKTSSEMQRWVRPVTDSGPLIFKHHSYTHITVDPLQDKWSDHHPLLFLSLNDGGIHKVTHNKSRIFVISEYRPFGEKTHVVSVLLHRPSKKLYVNSRSELVQLDVENCAQYGDGCEGCVLARDPDCYWDGTHCAAATRGTKQDVAPGDLSVCLSEDWLLAEAFAPSSYAQPAYDDDVVTVTLPPGSKYFLRCPVSSHHAQYTWHHNGSSASCRSGEPQCLFLIDSMGAEHVGDHTCVSEEEHHSRVLATYQLQLRSRAAPHWTLVGPLVWVSLAAALII